MSNQIVISSGAKVRSLNGVITGTTGVLDSLPINASNGIPQLDVNGKILVSQLPNSVMEYQGTWNANTNTPTLTNGGAFNQGDVYLCNVAGTTDFGAGPIAFVVGDQVIYSGSIWQRASGASGTVTSVAVTESGDALTITGSPITTSGTINIGFAGISSQYVAGNGALVTFPTLTGYVPYTGATQDVDLGAFKLNAQSLHAKGTAGLGHLGLKHQSASATASANEASLFADSLGDLSWLNGNIYLSKFITSSNTAARSYTFPNANGTVALTSDISYPVTSVFGRTGAVVATEGDYSLTQLSDVTITSPSNGQVLKYNGTLWINDTDANSGTVTSVAALTLGTTGTDLSSTVANGTTTPVITLNVPTASATNRGALSSADWSTFNNKQSTLSLTTTGNSGSATLVSNTLNVPTYTLAGLGGISLTSLSATTPLSYNNTTGAFSIQVANTSQDGYLSSTDWNTFNSKQSTITNPVTGTGTSGQVTYFNGTSSVTSSSNFKFDGTNLTIGNPSSALAQLHVFNSSAAASFLLQTNSTTDYSEIAVRNNSSTATSYFRQYSTAATGSDFGISRAGLALFFSNYATNFAIGTRNGGDLILGTNDIERARVLSSNGYFGLGTSTPSYLLDVNGTGRFTGAVTIGTDFAQLLPISASNYQLLVGNYYDGTNLIATATSGSRTVYNVGGMDFRTFTGATVGSSVTDTSRLTIASTGAATFSSSVTAGGYITGQGSNPGGLGGSRFVLDWLSGQMRVFSYGANTSTNGGFVFNSQRSDGTNSINYLDIASTGAATFSSSVQIQSSNGIKLNRSANDYYWQINSDSSNYLNFGAYYGNGTAYGTNPKMILLDNGNVGIGTSSPAQVLTIDKGASTAYIQIIGQSRNMYIGQDSTGAGIYSDGAAPMYFSTNATERMRITSGGNVGIGTSNADWLFKIEKNTASGGGGQYPAMVINNTNAAGYMAYYFFSGATNKGGLEFSNGTNELLISSVGTVKISTLGTGAVTATAGVLSTTSDMNLKISDGYIDTALDKILKLTPRYFYWKEESGLPTDLRQLGFYAQEVNEVLGEEVANTPKTENDKWGIYDRGIIAMLVKSIQELEARLKTIENK